MGLRGPKPKPKTWFIKSGVRPRTSLDDTPDPPRNLPQCPDWLDEEAKACWKELVPLLDEMQVLTVIDGKMLVKYCQLWSRWVKAEQFIQRYGNSYPIKNDNGSVKCFVQYPEVAIARTLAMQLTRLGAEFGMSPSARTRIHVPVRMSIA
jgi:P27 family predicted phage terminase small subunit